jgi:Domain of unknown function (DUF4249)
MRKIYWAIFYLLLTACVDPISFSVPFVGFQLVVDGMITDEAGPYLISLGTVRSVNTDFSTPAPVAGGKITLLSSDGESENLIETETGVFRTSSIQGKVGVAYWIRITMPGGSVYESDPEKMAPVGVVEAVNYEFESYPKTVGGAITTGGRFNIFTDGRTVPGAKYIRWRLLGTYKVENFPDLKTRPDVNGDPIADPLPCSGAIANGNILITVAPCTCCICWVSEYGLPVVYDDQLVADGVFKHVRVGSVDITSRTFYDKYYVEVQQMALTEAAFNFWKIVQAQKEGTSSLFQPIIGKLKGNIRNLTHPEEPVSGYFGAASVKRKGIFITRKEVPFQLQPIEKLPISCVGTNSTTTQPPFWK